jgi:TRAP-type C4-dicarboxylate transport system substrate-binding protein
MEHRERGLTLVLVNRDKLLEKVKENRENHRAKFEEAMEGYKRKAIQLLEEHIDRIANNAPERVIVNLPYPVDHTEDYDRVVEQLEWSLDDTLELNEQEFNTYVRDQWGWKQAFQETHTMYSSS